LPALALALLVVHIDVPAASTCVVFALSALMGYTIGFLLNFVLNCSAFWTLEISAVQMIVTWLTGILGGELIPLTLFPPWLKNFVDVLPFASIFSTPLSIYVGTIGPAQYLHAIGVQLLWVLGFGLIATFAWRLGAQRIVVQGG